MKKIDEIKEKFNNFEIKKSWQWLLYIYFVLPVLLFVLAFVGGDGAMGIYFSKIFHAYNLYVICPIPDIASLTGLVGLAIPAYLLFKAYRRKDYKDMIICAVMIICVAIYFYFEVNYILIKFLKFGGTKIL